MRVLIDTSIFISYLLTSNRQSPIHAVVSAALSPDVKLLMPGALLEELLLTATKKPHLASSLSLESLQTLVEVLHEVAELIPAITDPIPRVTRDPKEDYLLAYAVVGQANYLIAGDRDLLTLDKVEQVAIVSPATFASLIRP